MIFPLILMLLLNLIPLFSVDKLKKVDEKDSRDLKNKSKASLIFIKSLRKEQRRGQDPKSTSLD